MAHDENKPGASARPPLLEAAMALLQASPGQRMNTVILNKALFYLDLLALRELGHAITGSAYVALDQGPVVAKYDKRLVDALAKAGLAEQQTQGMAKPIVVKNRIEKFDSLGDVEKNLVATVAKAISRFSSTEASDRSHNNPGWIAAYESGKKATGKPKVINMLVAMQELVDEDEWMTADLDDSTKDAVNRAGEAVRTW